MGRAGKALKQILEAYQISQNQLSIVMGVDRSNVSRWVSESRDPAAETVLEIRDALEKIEPSAAEEFSQLYWNQTSEEN